MIIFKHAFKRSLSQRASIVAIFLLPIAFVFIPAFGNSYPNGLYLNGMTIFFTSFLLCRPLVEERLNKISVRISAAPIQYMSYLASHLLAYTVILINQNLIFLLVFRLRWPDLAINYFSILMLYFLFDLLALTFCLFWNSLFKSYTLSFGLFSGVGSIMCLVTGISIPLKMIPENFQNLVLVLPTYWLPYGIDSLYAKNIEYTILSGCILLVYSGIFFLIGSKRRYV